ncbi:MAG: aminotransferase class I/II-fold pyridoxal phosphate-dependent enzyme [Lachnospiraceae bacterium]|uniref:Aminotransferase class I/II-fold pyridoxal phosphate-dependent enzyme n=1 Tax=Candidatus Weimeria bifida TaxID=2599074 RepID=A0A6N7IYQ9_9FIRM|nr:aminotransferase class I/II-fold pyridoxal phosphate-dependent enzyme [Candidatus Weimeria bifida]RRF96354.1 MAG: aminotransferase class I/II-fold pyridoxal phosphate-dependent enzyme [Lachnospiraceae bacterium]
MLKHKDHFHGSDMELIEKIYGIKKEEIVSFSANVNPLGISPKLASDLSDHVHCIETYPDREYSDLRKAISSYAGCDPHYIIVGNGATELISLFISVTAPKRALILGPTYSEYEREITLNGGRTSYYPLREENDFTLQIDDFISKLTDDIDLIVLCNPNNPTSSVIKNRDMRLILDACKVHDIYVMVDETYVEFVSDEPLVTSVPLTADYNNLIVLRGTSKFFASPGLRLGYAVTGNEDLLKEINQKKNPWMISSLAEEAGKIMFNDIEYIKATKDLITSEKKRLYDIFKKSSVFKPYYPNANFMLLQILDKNEDSHSLFDKCIKQKLMIRDCSTFPFLSDRYIRICFMKPSDNDRLLEVLRP